jgi:hypothetical protein
MHKNAIITGDKCEYSDIANGKEKLDLTKFYPSEVLKIQ